MKRHMLKTAGTLVIVLMASSGVSWADQARPRNPGAAGGSSGGSGGSSGGSSGGGDTGRVATPRGGGSAPWDGGSAATPRPTRPASGGTTTTANRSGRGVTDSSGTESVPGYSRPRDGAFATGRAIPRTSIGTLPPVISGPIYWGAGDAWYFYPWGYGALGLGYLWDPWFWGGYGGYWGAGAPAWGSSGMGWGGGGGYTSYGSSGSGGGYSSSSSVQNPDVTGALRLRVTPRSAEVYVDGYFTGKVDDFDGAFQRLKLPPGPHRVDIQANGYETLSFDVLVIEDEVTTYKGALVRQR